MTDVERTGRPRSVAAALQDGTIRKVAQNFYTKSALIAVSSRTSLPQSFDRNEIKVDKWFGVTLDDSDVLKEELSHWSNLGIAHSKPSPLFVEVYLDSAELARRDTIVIKDERGGKHDACQVMGKAINAARPYSTKATRIVLERWKIDLVDDVTAVEESHQESIAAVYKKAVVLFRSLYTFARLLPAWDFSRRLAKEPTTLRSLRPTYHVYREDPSKSQARDPLSVPLYTSAEPTTDRHVFHPISTPAGSMTVEVNFRRNCDFRVDDAEAFISAQMLDEDVQGESTGGLEATDHAGRDAGSLPSNRRPGPGVLGRDQAYGSMSTFHRAGGQTGTSPMSALRAAGLMNVESPTEESPRKLPPDQTQPSKPAMQVPTNVPRRVSVSFQPFKAGSLASSPGRMAVTPTSPRPPSIEAPSPGSAPHSRDPSLTSATPQQSSFKPSVAIGPEVAVGSPGASSPKAPPMTRYSSSFGHRRSRFSSGGSVKGEDGGTSSGKGSQSSSNQPGSGLLAEGETSEPGSVETDDTQISDFLKLIEAKKDLKSFNKTDDASKEAAARRTSAALNKYRGMRDSHAALSESMSSSILGQSPAPSASSRQPGSVPPTLVGTSTSTSSSPGKPMSPHTPHTPAVPSRLSAQANLDDQERTGQRSWRGERASNVAESQSSHGTGAIDIPTSPQRYPHIRRPSSAGNNVRAIEDEFGMRTSTSVPPAFDGREGTDLSLSELFALNDPPGGLGAAPAQRRNTGQDSQTKESDDAGAGAMASGSVDTPEAEKPAPPFFRTRLGRGGAAGRGSMSSTGTGGSGERSARYSFSNRPGAAVTDDDEPLVFTMSDMGNRRSLEEGDSGEALEGGSRREGRRSGWS